MTNIIDGKQFANNLRAKIAQETTALKKLAITPGLAVVLVGDDPASHVYVRNKHKKSLEVGFHSEQYLLAESTTEDELLAVIDRLNNDDTIHGILVQLPLPQHINEKKVINAIDPNKDVDGFSYINVGKLTVGESAFIPCTPLGCLLLLKDYFNNDLSGKNVVVIGRSNIVGKPMASLMLQENATVTIAHSHTKDIATVCQMADIIIVAVGQPKMIKKEWISEGTVILDVGINSIEVDGKRKLVGDVDFDNVKEVAGAISPVPGGVGPMTIACLLKNTLTSAKMQLQK